MLDAVVMLNIYKSNKTLKL